MIIIPAIGVSLDNWSVLGIISFYYVEILLITLISWIAQVFHGDGMVDGLLKLWGGLMDMVWVLIVFPILIYLLDAFSLEGPGEVPDPERIELFRSYCFQHLLYLIPIELLSNLFYKDKGFTERYSPDMQTRIFFGFFGFFLFPCFFLLLICIALDLQELAEPIVAIASRAFMDLSKRVPV